MNAGAHTEPVRSKGTWITLQELIAQKDKRIRDLEADKQQLQSKDQADQLLKEKIDLLTLLIRRSTALRLQEREARCGPTGIALKPFSFLSAVQVAA
jgi:hypothetical protein